VLEPGCSIQLFGPVQQDPDVPDVVAVVDTRQLLAVRPCVRLKQPDERGQAFVPAVAPHHAVAVDARPVEIDHERHGGAPVRSIEKIDNVLRNVEILTSHHVAQLLSEVAR
jgi:hypothetical protein